MILTVLSLSIPLPLILMLILSAFIIIAIVVLTRYALKQEETIRRNGLYADSVVIRCTSRRDDGRTRHTTVVRYTGDDGKEHEGTLNYAGEMPIGRKVKIQYLPGRYNYVIFISQEL